MTNGNTEAKQNNLLPNPRAAYSRVLGAVACSHSDDVHSGSSLGMFRTVYWLPTCQNQAGNEAMGILVNDSFQSATRVVLIKSMRQSTVS